MHTFLKVYIENLVCVSERNYFPNFVIKKVRRKLEENILSFSIEIQKKKVNPLQLRK